MPQGIAKKSAAVFGVLGLGGIGALAMPLAAQAVPVCATVVGLPAPTVLPTGVCEIRISTVGSGTYTFPSTAITKVAAVLVGGGGGGFDDAVGGGGTGHGYGGSGGGVTYVDSVTLDASVTIAVGAGGAGYTRTVPPPAVVGGVNGASTSINATSAGMATAMGGFGGGGNYSGDGAGGPSTGTDGITPGPGLLIEAVTPTPDPALFPAVAAAGSDATFYSPGGGGDDGTIHPVPSTVTGAGGAARPGLAQNGLNGLVILRYLPQEPYVAPPAGPALAATGTDSGRVLLAGLELLSLGAILLMVRRVFPRRTS